MRSIKFRAWTGTMMEQWDHIKTWESLGHRLSGSSEFKWMQFTGNLDSTGSEIYEGDIKRITIEEAYGDNNIFCICTWIKEWSMFAWLVESEYEAYLAKGVEILDETMFWTYNMEDDTATVCANIYEHPDYIRKCRQTEEQTMREADELD